MIAAAFLLAASAAAQPPMLSDGSAESRLNACIAAGAAGGYADLASAVIAVRALCGAQIRQVADARMDAATRGVPRAQTDAVRAAVRRDLNHAIAVAVAQRTGLAYP